MAFCTLEVESSSFSETLVPIGTKLYGPHIQEGPNIHIHRLESRSIMRKNVLQRKSFFNEFDTI
jgi:hypothetical protein